MHAHDHGHLMHACTHVQYSSGQFGALEGGSISKIAPSNPLNIKLDRLLKTSSSLQQARCELLPSSPLSHSQSLSQTSSFRKGNAERLQPDSHPCIPSSSGRVFPSDSCVLCFLVSWGASSLEAPLSQFFARPSRLDPGSSLPSRSLPEGIPMKLLDICLEFAIEHHMHAMGSCFQWLMLQEGGLIFVQKIEGVLRSQPSHHLRTPRALRSRLACQSVSTCSPATMLQRALWTDVACLLWALCCTCWEETPQRETMCFPEKGSTCLVSYSTHAHATGCP